MEEVPVSLHRRVDDLAFQRLIWLSFVQYGSDRNVMLTCENMSSLWFRRTSVFFFKEHFCVLSNI